MTVAAQGRPPVATNRVRPAFAAARLRFVLGLCVLSGADWWWMVKHLHGMDAGPWTALGTMAWFLGVWVVMMAAMMLPSVAPTVALYARMTRTRSRFAPVAFTGGYLLTWAVAGVVAFACAAVASRLPARLLAWDHAGRLLAGVTLIAAAVYELTPLKNACLGKCRSPLGSLLGSWRDGLLGALRMGAKNGAWCVGCCWALMASLFALGVMSITWMALVAGLITIEKTLPWRRSATYGTAAVLLALGVLLLISPGAVPGLTVPGAQPMR